MELLFNITADTKTIGETNFKDCYPQVKQNMSAQAFKVEIRQVTRDMLIPYITPQFYNHIAVKFQAGNPVWNEGEAEVLELMQDCISYYVVWSMSSKTIVTVGDMGTQEHGSRDGTSQPAAAWRFFHHHWKVMLKADKLLDTILEKLESSPDKFPVFHTAKPALLLHNHFIRHTSEFEEFVNLNGSRRTFLKLRPAMKKAARRHARPVLGNAQYDALLTAVQTGGDLGDANKKLLPYIQAVVAQYSIYNALPSLDVMIANNGLFHVTTTDGMNTKQRAHKEAVAAFQEMARKEALEAEKELIEFLIEHADSYPVWRDDAARKVESYGDEPFTFGDGGAFVM